jgi:hypothetical protein
MGYASIINHMTCVLNPLPYADSRLRSPRSPRLGGKRLVGPRLGGKRLGGKRLCGYATSGFRKAWMSLMTSNSLRDSGKALITWETLRSLSSATLSL